MTAAVAASLATPTEMVTSAEGDAGLLARCREGDQGAFRLLYQRHARQVMAHASRLGLRASEVEDVAQDVFSALFEDVQRIRAETLEAWLYRLTSNRVNDRHRRRRVRETFARILGRADEGTEGSPAEAALERRDAQRLVRQIVERMGKKKRDVFVMFELEKIPGEQIAERLGIPLATVWTRLHHARLDFVRIGRALELADRQARGPR